MGLIERHEVARHCAVNENSKQSSTSLTYFGMKNNNHIQVCHNAYIRLHAISNKAVTT